MKLESTIKLVSLSSDPSNGTDGEIYFNTTQNTTRVYEAGSWKNLTDSGTPSDYVFDQVSPSATWNITHNMSMYPNVTIIDSGGSMVEAEVTYINLNSLMVEFNGATSGKAYLS